MNTELKTLLRKGSIFILPIIAWVCIVIIVDPFNYFNLSSTISKNSKENSAQKLNSLLYNSINFKNHPTNSVIIGDSRIKRLPIKEIKQITGDNYFILHSNAAKLNEIIDLFWISTNYTELENVILGINFNLYNEYAYANRVDEIEKMIKNPLLYIFNGNILEITFKALLHKFTGSNIPNISRNIMLKRAIKEAKKFEYEEAMGILIGSALTYLGIRAGQNGSTTVSQS